MFHGFFSIISFSPCVHKLHNNLKNYGCPFNHSTNLHARYLTTKNLGWRTIIYNNNNLGYITLTVSNKNLNWITMTIQVVIRSNVVEH